MLKQDTPDWVDVLGNQSDSESGLCGAHITFKLSNVCLLAAIN